MSLKLAARPLAAEGGPGGGCPGTCFYSGRCLLPAAPRLPGALGPQQAQALFLVGEAPHRPAGKEGVQASQARLPASAAPPAARPPASLESRVQWRPWHWRGLMLRSCFFLFWCRLKHQETAYK